MELMVDYGEIISEALKKDTFSTRSLPMIIITISAAISVYMIATDFIFNFLHHLIIHDMTALLWNIITFVAQVFAVLFLFWISSLFAGGIIMKQAVEERPFMESASFVSKKMLSMIFAGILISFFPDVLGVGLLHAVPYVGSLLSLVASILIELIVFVTYPVIILENSGAINGISSSIRHFFAHKIDIFIIWLLMTVISLIILIVFSIPLVVYFIFFVLSLLSHRESYHIEVLVGSLPFLIMSTLIFAIGIAMTIAFSYGVRARYYARHR